MNVELWKRIAQYVRDARLADAVVYLEDGLARCKSKRFKSLISADFTNEPALIARGINDFIKACDQTFSVGAVYLEMNGFDINPDRWYFDYFAYEHYVQNTDDPDWLGRYDSPHWPETTLTGLEQVQREYHWYSNQGGYKDELAKEANEYATLLVMCKYGHLIERSVSVGLIKKIPVLATAHDFDIIPRFDA